MSTETITTDPKSSQEMDMAVTCGHEGCLHETVLTATVTVGDVEQEWCLDCVTNEFGLDWGDYQQRQQSILRFITPATVSAFLLGSLLMLLVSSIAVV